jgi:hypothetical protein
MNIIYHLEKNKVPFYVGKSKNPKSRFYNHTRTYGKDIKMIILEECDNWKEAECRWIKEYTSRGYNLQNKNKGGGGPETYQKWNPKRYYTEDEQDHWDGKTVQRYALLRVLEVFAQSKKMGVNPRKIWFTNFNEL